MTICSVFFAFALCLRPFLKKGADRKDKAITRSGG